MSDLLKKNLKWIVLGVLIIAVAAALFMLPSPNREALAEGSSMPDFRLKDLEGNDFFSNQQTGKVVLLNFWATWCTYCLEEQPHLQDFTKKYSNNDIQVVSVLSDFENIDLARDIMDKNGVTYPVLIDKSKGIFKTFGIEDTNLPYSLIVDRKGKIRFIHPGFNKNDIPTYEKEIEQLISEGK